MNIKKFLAGLAAVAILGLAAIFIVVPVLSQSPALSQESAFPPGEYDLEAGQYVFNEPDGDVLSLDLSGTFPTDTPVPVTDTPAPPTATPVPLTPTPEGTIPPFAGASVCGDANTDGHEDVTDNPFIPWNSKPDNQIGHDLWNEVDGCHYSHEHKDDPHDLDDIFGTEIYDWAGGEISYPWQTWAGIDAGVPPAPGIMENDIKHECYGWLTGRGNNEFRGSGYITDFRVQYHACFDAKGATSRTHSFWVEARICDATDCGIVRTGGHVDWGILTYILADDPTFTDIHIPLPDDPPPEFQTTLAWRRHKPDGVGAIWYGNFQAERNHWVATLSILSDDNWGPIDIDDPYNQLFFCPDFQCEFNASIVAIHQLLFSMPPSYDDDGDGIIDVIGWSGRRGGRLFNDCGAFGPDCIPMQFIGIPLGYYEYMEGTAEREYDISPPGEFWIEHPN